MRGVDWQQRKTARARESATKGTVRTANHTARRHDPLPTALAWLRRRRPHQFQHHQAWPCLGLSGPFASRLLSIMQAASVLFPDAFHRQFQAGFADPHPWFSTRQLPAPRRSPRTTYLQLTLFCSPIETSISAHAATLLDSRLLSHGPHSVWLLNLSWSWSAAHARQPPLEQSPGSSLMLTRLPRKGTANIPLRSNLASRNIS